jgi:phospholipid/cholesterol/gamma-HCH transport system substrate-binding protein
MQKKTIEKKVGFFVLVALIMLAALLLQFSRGTTLLRSTYRIDVHTENVSGMARGASVQLSGVRIGHVAEIRLLDNGRTVSLELKIGNEFKIYDDATFAIETSGFLGDQFVAVYPQGNDGVPLEDGDVVEAEAPFNIQEMARAATGFIDRIDQTARKLNEAITRVDRMALSEENLTNLSDTIHNLRATSLEAFSAVQSLQTLIKTNSPALGQSLSNVLHFSAQLNNMATDLQTFVGNTTGRVGVAAENVEISSQIMRELLEDVQAGKGLAGSLTADEELSTHISMVASNLSVTTSNLNSLGLWRILWKPKPPKKESSTAAEERVYPGRTPFD